MDAVYKRVPFSKRIRADQLDIGSFYFLFLFMTYIYILHITSVLPFLFSFYACVLRYFWLDCPLVIISFPSVKDFISHSQNGDTDKVAIWSYPQMITSWNPTRDGDD